MNQQIEFWLPPPITAHDAAAIIGKLGGQARARQQRQPILAKTREMRVELKLAPDPRLGG